MINVLSKKNLVPNFIIGEELVQVNSNPNINVKKPTINHHFIYIPSNDFRIHLSPWGVFSYLLMSNPTNKIF